MVAKHRGLGITPEQRHRFASLMSLAAEDVALPADPEFRAALVGYLEWETRLGDALLPAGCRRGAARPGAALGLGGGSSVHALVFPR
jgi:hypothetical protein